jgi:4-amino-4-deoxy-L-arabinose transferase-like glycosyltransferase
MNTALPAIERVCEGDGLQRAGWLFWITVALVAATCLGLKIPVMYRQHAAGDEDFYGVPGLTLLEEGRLRVPFVPSRDRESMFYRADERLLTLPPLYFFLQAAGYAAFGATIGSARLMSGLAGVVSIMLLGAIAWRMTRSRFVALVAVTFYAASRVVYFPWLMSRPDTLMGMFGFASLLVVLKAVERPSVGRASLGGALAGLGLYTHPYALVYCAQEGLMLLAAGRSARQRLGLALAYSAMALGVASLWLIQIAADPPLWREQFLDLMGNRSGSGLLSRLIWPGHALMVQSLVFLEHTGPWQCVLMLGGVVTAVVGVCGRGGKRIAFLTVSVMYLHVSLLGTHPTKGYWCYGGGLMWLAFAMAVERMGRFPRTGTARALLTAVLIVGSMAMMVPGCGLRTLVQHIRHWKEIEYDAPRFVRFLIGQLPPDALLAVDQAYAFEFYAAGRRNMILALEFPLVFSTRQFD